MSRHKSDAARIVQFFRDQPLEVAESIYGLVTEEMRIRRPKKTAKGSKPTKPKANAAAAGVTQAVTMPAMSVTLPAGGGPPKVNV
jgi:hypothetical protein